MSVTISEMSGNAVCFHIQVQKLRHNTGTLRLLTPIRRDYQTAVTIDRIKEVSPEAGEKILSKEYKVNDKVLQKMKNVTDDEIIDATIKILNDEPLKPNAEPKPVPPSAPEPEPPAEPKQLSKKESNALIMKAYAPDYKPERAKDELAEGIGIDIQKFIENMEWRIANYSTDLSSEGKKATNAALLQAETAIKKIRKDLNL